MKIKFLVALLALIVSISLGTPVFAQDTPVPPHQFWGQVTIGGSDAPDDTVVSASIEGVATTWSTTTRDGKYGYDPLFKIPIDDPETAEKDGGVNDDEVIFKVNGDVVETDPQGPISFESGGTTLVNLTLEGPVAEPTISISPTSLTFNATEGGANPADQTLEIWNSGTGTLDWSVNDDATWLTLLPTSGSSIDEHDSVTVSVDISGMSASDYPATITISAPGATNTPQTASVGLHISATEPDISVNPTSKNFGEVTVDSSSSAQTFTVSNAGTASLLVGTITITEANADQFTIQNDDCSGETIALNSSATLQVVFSPTSTGAKSATLEIPSNDPDEATVEVSLSGTGGTAVSGGGGSAPTPTYYTETNLFGTEDSFSISNSGKVLETIEATSADGNLTITIRKYTIALDKDGDRLASLETAVDETPPEPLEDAYIIGIPYDFGPDGATFDPPITFTWSYDPEALPDDVAEEDLVLAYYDEATGEWVELDGVVDTENNTITASVAHFTTFAIIGSVTEEEVVVPPDEEEVVPPDEEEVVPPDEEEVVPLEVVIEEEVVPLEPAAFSVASLSVTPLEVESGETVTITALVANTGDLTGSYEVTLKINNTVIDTKEVTLDGGASQTVTFTTFKNVDEVYTVSVDGLSGSFTVVPVVVPPTPGFNWALLVGIIAAVIVVGVVSFFLIRRRRFA